MREEFAKNLGIRSVVSFNIFTLWKWKQKKRELMIGEGGRIRRVREGKCETKGSQCPKALQNGMNQILCTQFERRISQVGI